MLCLVICCPTHGKFCSVGGSSRTTAQRLALKCGAVEELVHLLQMTYSVPRTWNVENHRNETGNHRFLGLWSVWCVGKPWNHGKPGFRCWGCPSHESYANSRLPVKIPKFGPGSVHYGSLVNIKIRDKWMLMKYGTFWLFDVSMENHYFNWNGNHYISSVNEPFTIAMFNSQRVYIIGFHMPPWVEYLCNVSGWHAWAHLQQ